MNTTDFNNVFDKSVSTYNASLESKESIFESFRSQKEIYGYIDNGDYPPDSVAVAISEYTNKELYNKYEEHNRKKLILGYKNSPQTHAGYTNLDSRHIMMSVLLFSWLKQEVGTVVEIGGGFGNWLRLNTFQSFDKWSIIDMPHVGLLQRWFLAKEKVDESRYELVSAFDYDGWNCKNSGYDLIIGSHSLSEFALPIFEEYFNKVVLKSKYLFFCYHLWASDSIAKKMETIEKNFTLVNSALSENNEVANSLYKNKWP